jgi:hypothetical protein
MRWGAFSKVISLPKYNTEIFEPSEICEAIETMAKEASK